MLYFNKYAPFKYDTDREYEAGMSLVGTQVKEIRKGIMNLKECNVRVINDEVIVVNTGLSTDKIRLLLNKYEILRIKLYLDEKRHHVFLIGIFTKGRILKMKIATGVVKKQYQKTAQQKRKDDKISMAREMKQKNYDF